MIDEDAAQLRWESRGWAWGIMYNIPGRGFGNADPGWAELRKGRAVHSVLILQPSQEAPHMVSITWRETAFASWGPQSGDFQPAGLILVFQTER